MNYIKGATTVVESILLEHKDMTAAELVEKYNLADQTIRNIKYLATTKAADAYATLKVRGLNPVKWSKSKRFTDVQVRDIRTSKKSSGVLARRYDVAPSTIRMIRTGKTYTHV